MIRSKKLSFSGLQDTVFKIIFDKLPAWVFCRAAFQEGGDDLTPKLQSDPVLYSQSGSGPEVATVAEQQQQFVQQMLHSLANRNDEVCQCLRTNMCMPVPEEHELIVPKTETVFCDASS